MGFKVRFMCAIIAVSTAFCSVFASYASAKTEQISDYEILTTTKTPSELSGSLVSVDVYADGDGANALIEDNAAENIKIMVYHDQKVSGAKGEIKLEFAMDKPSGWYNIVFGGTDKPADERFYYANKTDYEQKINALIDAESQNIVFEIVSENMDLFGFSGFIFKNSNLNRISDYMYKALKASSISKDDSEKRNKVNAIWKKAVILDALLNGDITDICEYSKEIGADKIGIDKYFARKFIKDNAAFRNEMSGKIKADAPNSLDEFDESTIKQLILTAAHLPDGAQNLKDVIDDFGKSLGINSCSLNICEKIMGVYYKNIADLKSAISKAAELSQSNGSTSGGSGGKNYGGGGIGKVGTDAPNNEPPKPIEESEPFFDDLESVDWAVDAIEYLAAKGVINGKSDRIFAPNDNVTREEFVKILVSAFEISDSDTEPDFSDVVQSDWFYPYISKAISAKIISGYDDNRFGTGDFITRQDICVMVWRTMQSMRNVSISDILQNEFEDSQDVSDYAKDAVNTLFAIGIINGKGNNIFAPRNFATRAEAAKIIYNAVTAER